MFFLLDKESNLYSLASSSHCRDGRTLDVPTSGVEDALPNEHSETVTIYINTKPFTEPRGKISYDRVVELAYPDFAQFPQATYSIVYERGHEDKPQGTLTKGSEVQIVKDMRFRVKRTGES
jgi:hypothetical protein